MRPKIVFLSVWILFILGVSCKNESVKPVQASAENEIIYANGFSLLNYDSFSILEVNRPWPNAVKPYKYILVEKGSVIPDSLKRLPLITIPISNYIVTSTTHIPALELLNETKGLIGFPGLDFVSSKVVRERINHGEIVDIGQNEQLNTELILDIEPDVVIAFGMDGVNSALQSLTNAGVDVVYNGDWAEQSPLGKAEWIKLFGALFNKQNQATEIFNKIVSDYNATLESIKGGVKKPTVMSGAMYQDVWYTPQGDSWMALYFKDAQANYIWKESKGTGSLALSFEEVYEKAENADFWINPGQYETLESLKLANPHYSQFNSYKNASVYSLTEQKGETGGVLFFELGPARPDLVLKDLVSIFHPHLLVDYTPVFYKKL
ncbi:ABC transporter substrate-binding protein [Myroides guanonis]|uniref:Iron complex transport system substrate-binding protein n=1 Tax=Myroides guanonis TaxID=1150112 RepID=A0A1I3QT90_9FLAO|nr:ABC transporter substrate-binding protein [Myroides guanonis]SFJ36471.1 iron complex transport system substrate-binding protein [Myroides guanonis]